MSDTCVFTFVNNINDYNKLNIKDIFIFTSFYKNNCIFIDKKINLFDCFLYFRNKKQYNKYIYFSSKCNIIPYGLDSIFIDEKSYLNYFEENIYFLKFEKILYDFYEIFENNLNSENFINFLSDYFCSFEHEINNTFINKFILPKSKILYNKKDKLYEKLRYKTHIGG